MTRIVITYCYMNAPDDGCALIGCWRTGTSRTSEGNRHRSVGRDFRVHGSRAMCINGKPSPQRDRHINGLSAGEDEVHTTDLTDNV